MRKIFRRAPLLALVSINIASLICVEAAMSDTNTINSGFNLPGVTLPQGHDEVRAADGTTCRSAISGSGAYLDVGVIGNPEQEDQSSSVSAYGRVVIPLGNKAKRLDCSKLYSLEVQRLEIELKLMQMGLTRGIAPVSEGTSSHQSSLDLDNDFGSSSKDQPKAVKLAKSESEEASWVDDGWSTKGLKK